MVYSEEAPLLQILDDANERVAIALFDKALRVQAHHRPANRIAFVAAYAESETALVSCPISMTMTEWDI